MKVVPISAYLNEFAVEPIDELAKPDSRPGLVEMPVAPVPVPVPVAMVDKSKQRYLDGIIEGEKQAKLNFSRELKDQEELLVEQHNKVIAKLHEQFAEQISDQLTSGISHLEMNLSNVLAAVVRPFVSELLQNKIIGELQEAIFDILRDSESSQLTIKGPQVMLDRLKTGLDDAPLPIKFIENDGLEISVDLAHAKIETRFQLWSKLLENEIG